MMLPLLRLQNDDAEEASMDVQGGGLGGAGGTGGEADGEEAEGFVVEDGFLSDSEGPRMVDEGAWAWPGAGALGCCVAHGVQGGKARARPGMHTTEQQHTHLPFHLRPAIHMSIS